MRSNIVFLKMINLLTSWNYDLKVEPTITVLLFPPNALCRSLVSVESRKGTAISHGMHKALHLIMQDKNRRQNTIVLQTFCS